MIKMSKNYYLEEENDPNSITWTLVKQITQVCIVKILKLYIILLCTHLYHTSFQLLSSNCNAFIACYIRHKKTHFLFDWETLNLKVKKMQWNLKVNYKQNYFKFIIGIAWMLRIILIWQWLLSEIWNEISNKEIVVSIDLIAAQKSCFPYNRIY